jgi:hypothetical protein
MLVNRTNKNFPECGSSSVVRYERFCGTPIEDEPLPSFIGKNPRLLEYHRTAPYLLGQVLKDGPSRVGKPLPGQ